jgi:hypothetical protein
MYKNQILQNIYSCLYSALEILISNMHFVSYWFQHDVASSVMLNTNKIIVEVKHWHSFILVISTIAKLSCILYYRELIL